ncbi:MAG: hypothetical protein WBW16_15600 [Bacteroidota bacterium]
MPDQSNIDRQFGFVNNLYIALAAGVLTVLVNLSFNTVFKTLDLPVRYILTSSAFLFFLSLVIGVYLAWFRISYYRIGSQYDQVTDSEKKEKLRDLLVAEKRNRNLLKYQGIFLLLGSLAMLLSLLWQFYQSFGINGAA